MEWIQIIGMVLIAVVLLALLKQYNPVYAVIAGILCCGLVLTAAIAAMFPVMDSLLSLAEQISAAQMMPLVKAMGIVILGQIARDVCKDAGQTALAGQVELAARALVLFAALPLFQQLLQVISGLLG